MQLLISMAVTRLQGYNKTTFDIIKVFIIFRLYIFYYLCEYSTFFKF